MKNFTTLKANIAHREALVRGPLTATHMKRIGMRFVAAWLSTAGMVLSQTSKLSQFTQKEPPCGIALSIIEQRETPVIAKGMPGTEHNKYGFEARSRVGGKSGKRFHLPLCRGRQVDGHLIGYADSADGVHWSTAEQLEVDCTKLWVSDIQTPMGLVEESGGTFTLFYTGFQSSNEGESKGWKEYRNDGMLKARLEQS